MWQRFKKYVRNYFIFIGVIATLQGIVVFLGLYLVLKNFSTAKPSLVTKIEKTPSLLTVTLDGPFRSDARPAFISQIEENLGAEQSINYLTLRSVLSDAVSNDLIKGLHLDVIAPEVNLSQAVALHELFDTFKKSGKPVTASSIELDTERLLMVSLAKPVSLPPSTSILITGPVLHGIFLGGLTRNLGLEFEVVKTGPYKSAFEMLTLNKPTEPVKKMNQELEKSLRESTIAMIARGRGSSENDVKEWLKQSLFVASEAQNKGIFDQVLVSEQAQEEALKALQITQKVSVSEYQAKFMNEGPIMKRLQKTKKMDGIALINLSGEIGLKSQPGSQQHISPEPARKALQFALDKEEVKAAIIRIDSPGGSAVASELIWWDVKKLASKKPVIISMGQVAASGGYYIAMAGSKVIAEPTTITGSIGVIGMIPRLAQFEKKYGVSFDVTTGSDRDNLLHPAKKLSPKDHELLEKHIEDTYMLFLKRVSEHRKMPVEKVRSLAGGHVYTGVQALKLNLVDELGGLDHAFRLAKTSAGLDPEKAYPLYTYQDQSHEALLQMLRFFSLKLSIKDLFWKTLGPRTTLPQTFFLAPEFIDWRRTSL